MNEEEKIDCLDSIFSALKTKCGTFLLENAIMSIINSTHPNEFSNLKKLCFQYVFTNNMHNDFTRTESIKKLNDCYKEMIEVLSIGNADDDVNVFYMDK